MFEWIDVMRIDWYTAMTCSSGAIICATADGYFWFYTMLVSYFAALVGIFTFLKYEYKSTVRCIIFTAILSIPFLLLWATIGFIIVGIIVAMIAAGVSVIEGSKWLLGDKKQ